jgi:hypothetical protein
MGKKIYMISHVKARSSTTYQILLVKFGEFPIESYALNLTIRFNNSAVVERDKISTTIAIHFGEGFV